MEKFEFIEQLILLNEGEICTKEEGNLVLLLIQNENKLKIFYFKLFLISNYSKYNCKHNFNF